MENNQIKKFLKIFLIFFVINLIPFILLWFFTPVGKYEIVVIANNWFRLLMDILLIVIPAIIFSLICYLKNKISKYLLLSIALLIFYTFIFYYFSPVFVNVSSMNKEITPPDKVRYLTVGNELGELYYSYDYPDTWEEIKSGATKKLPEIIYSPVLYKESPACASAVNNLNKPISPESLFDLRRNNCAVIIALEYNNYNLSLLDFIKSTYDPKNEKTAYLNKLTPSIINNDIETIRINDYAFLKNQSDNDTAINENYEQLFIKLNKNIIVIINQAIDEVRKENSTYEKLIKSLNFDKPEILKR